MQTLAAYYPEFLQFHEGLLGGTNARGDVMTSNEYEGWYYNHASPWMKITANVQGGDYNEFNGDEGNYPDRPDVMLVGNHHAREWMSYEVPMFFLETLAHYYGKAGIDNDGDGLIDEDGWDGIDNIIAQMKGWETHSFKDPKAKHQRRTGSHSGLVFGCFESGKFAYTMGYFPPFMIARSLHRMVRKPIIIGGISMLIGYIHSLLTRKKRINDPEVISFLRDKQKKRLKPW